MSLTEVSYARRPNLPLCCPQPPHGHAAPRGRCGAGQHGCYLFAVPRRVNARCVTGRVATLSACGSQSHSTMPQRRYACMCAAARVRMQDSRTWRSVLMRMHALS